MAVNHQTEGSSPSVCVNMKAKVIYFEVEPSTHTKDQCDKCQNVVGMKNLRPVSFLYKDMNDKFHKDMGEGYRQYYVCNKCYGHC